ncbi:MAG: hypothetical protein NVSMB62_13410 [Acidobacteriaceae bacterium]
MLLEGLHIPLTTPFHPDGRLNPHKLAANVVRYSKSPASGLIALAPHIGEPTLLSDDETREVLRTVAEAAAPEKVLLANISRDSVVAVLALAERADALAYDAVLVGSPSFLGDAVDDEPARGARIFFQTLADRSPLPVVLLATDTHRIPQSLIAELAARPNVLGLLDATLGSPQHSMISKLGAPREVTVTTTFSPVTGRMLRAAATVAPPKQANLVSAASLARNPAAAASAVAPLAVSPTALRVRTKTVGFQLMVTGASHLLGALNNGASAIAPAFAACAPQACYEVFAAWKDSDEGLALEKQDRIVTPARLAESLSPAGFKFGCDLNGYFGGLPRLPYLPPSAEERAELQRLMTATRT